jgi:hypothetical protein
MIYPLLPSLTQVRMGSSIFVRLIEEWLKASQFLKTLLRLVL